MDRRSFLALGAAAAASACAPASTSAPPSAPPAPHPDLQETTLADLGARMSRGEIRAVDLVEQYLARIDALDVKGPALRSVIERNPDALAIAEKLDQERRAKGPRGPLHGIPILVKDNLDTGDRMETTAGSLALAGTRAKADARAIAKLREAGAAILGKTNLSEWANIRSPKSTSGWSGRGGLTKNPYALDRNTSGSSSGSAAATAANLCAASIGTETDGSIVSPSSICGIVGLKPTVGLVSGAGIVPIAHTQDTAGPMTRTVADAALILAAIAEPPAEADPPRFREALARALVKDGAAKLRIGVARNIPNIGKQVMAIFDAAIEDLRKLGATIVDPVDLGPIAKIEDPELLVLLSELKADLATYLATRGPDCAVRTLEDVVKWNAAHAREELGFFGQEFFEQALQKGPLDGAAYKEALATCKRLARDEGIDAALRTHKLDVIAAPTGGPAWLSDLVNGDAFTGSSSTPAAVAGYPSITVPAGFLRGLPIGISFFAGAWSEPTLLRVAFAYEQATKRRAPPRYLPTVDL
jgi:amidase